MGLEFAADYLLWVFISALGAVQVAAARSNLRGIMFFRDWPRATQIVAVILIVAAYTWYFGTGFRNRPDTGVGLDANTQAWLFAVGGGMAVTLTLAVTSLFNHQWGVDLTRQRERELPDGITVLERTTFARALFARLLRIRDRLRSRPAEER